MVVDGMASNGGVKGEGEETLWNMNSYALLINHTHTLFAQWWSYSATSAAAADDDDDLPAEPIQVHKIAVGKVVPATHVSCLSLSPSPPPPLDRSTWTGRHCTALSEWMTDCCWADCELAGGDRCNARYEDDAHLKINSACQCSCQPVPAMCVCTCTSWCLDYWTGINEWSRPADKMNNYILSILCWVDADTEHNHAVQERRTWRRI